MTHLSFFVCWYDGEKTPEIKNFFCCILSVALWNVSDVLMEGICLFPHVVANAPTWGFRWYNVSDVFC